jgi:hypothetical protein
MRRTRTIPRDALRVGKSTTGLGLFAVRDIEPGMYVEYTGTLMPTAEANKLRAARYLFEVNGAWTIQGHGRDNLARYINHSCAPNCESVQDGKRIFIKALRRIQAGTELTYDYGEEYTDEFIKPHGCKCRKCLR